MRAVVLPRFGPPDVLEVRDIPRPTPAPGEILVKVMASATNPVEAKIRASGSWARINLPATIGYDAAGIIEDLGVGVSDFARGDEVFFTPEIFGNQHGTHAEYTVVPAAIVARKPPGLSFEDAAALPLAGGTAYEAIVRRLAVKVGETVLIHGGSGGVGAFAVQIARAAGARVIASAGPDNQDLLRQLGVHVPLDHTKDNVNQVALRETGGVGVDAVLDTVSGGLAVASVPAVRPFGRLAVILPPRGEASDFTALYLRNQTLHGVFLIRERARLEALARLAVQGQLRPVISAAMPLADVIKAHQRLDSGHARGKVILRPGA